MKQFRNMSEGDRERVIRIIDESKSGEYWAILKSVIVQWMKEENSILDSYKITGMRDKDYSEYNRAVDRIEYLQKFIKINETVIDYNISILKKIKSQVGGTIKKMESFLNLKFGRNGNE